MLLFQRSVLKLMQVLPIIRQHMGDSVTRSNTPTLKQILLRISMLTQ